MIFQAPLPVPRILADIDQEPPTSKPHMRLPQASSSDTVLSHTVLSHPNSKAILNMPSSLLNAHVRACSCCIMLHDPSGLGGMPRPIHPSIHPPVLLLNSPISGAHLARPAAPCLPRALGPRAVVRPQLLAAVPGGEHRRGRSRLRRSFRAERMDGTWRVLDGWKASCGEQVPKGNDCLSRVAVGCLGWVCVCVSLCLVAWRNMCDHM